MNTQVQSGAGGGWRRALGVTFAILGVALLFVVFLVLTGIIAEPETVIESIFRAIAGG